MKRVAVITTSRADFGIYRPLLAAIQTEPELDLLLVVAGMHLAPEMGLTVREIQAEGWSIAARVECLLSSDSDLGMAKSLGIAVLGYAETLARLSPDLVVILGDRFEMFAAAAAAGPLRLPLAHLYGGELTLGALDDAWRHAMTKLSHLHFVASEEYARRVVAMGEEPWRVKVCGALSLDNLAAMELLGREELARELEINLEPAPLLVTFHPETLADDPPARQMAEVLAALEGLARPTVFTLPNADAGGRELAGLVRAFCADHPWAVARDNLGTRRYFSLMRHAAAMLGNSSSGIIEAPSLGLPVVNLGQRQAGRTRGANLIDAACERGAILSALELALDPGFRAQAERAPNPYQRGGAARAICAGLLENHPRERLLRKRFQDNPQSGDRPQHHG